MDFVRGSFSGRFCPGWFCPFPFLSEYICYSRKLNITLNFMFLIYIKKFISVTSHALYPSAHCHTFSDPLERDVLNGRPQINIARHVQLYPKGTLFLLGRAACVPHNNSKEHSGRPTLITVYKELRRKTKTNSAILTTDTS